MSKQGRQVLRNRAKAEFKKLKKGSSQLKNVAFSDFFKHFKAGLIQKGDEPAGVPEHLEEDLKGLESIILDDDIEEELDDNSE